MPYTFTIHTKLNIEELFEEAKEKIAENNGLLTWSLEKGKI